VVLNNLKPTDETQRESERNWISNYPVLVIKPTQIRRNYYE